MHPPDLVGHPDFLFPQQRLILFVDGCFWHKCPKHKTIPSTNRAFWKMKIDGNAARDRAVARLLRREGWHVLRIWEHDLRSRPTAVVARVRRALEANQSAGVKARRKDA